MNKKLLRDLERHARSQYFDASDPDRSDLGTLDAARLVHVRIGENGTLYVSRLTEAGYRALGFVPCPGEAHSNPNIDHCHTCKPRWGWVR